MDKNSLQYKIAKYEAKMGATVDPLKRQFYNDKISTYKQQSMKGGNLDDLINTAIPDNIDAKIMEILKAGDVGTTLSTTGLNTLNTSAKSAASNYEKMYGSLDKSLGKLFEISPKLKKIAEYTPPADMDKLTELVTSINTEVEKINKMTYDALENKYTVPTPSVPAIPTIKPPAIPTMKPPAPPGETLLEKAPETPPPTE
ncbi:MAG: hypothetical protein Edafosvirus14_14 [Edafosvirus sp.]|uniref:Uncharacterized protein n=1 Tax=Edafosvirus sp. TaxID=2487765 RepID=A0A3G4ZUA4_9VIRU|nr:MAG: hypothetical protein Edafosvirus14_14 [Edafosvirus sp.]